MLVITRDLFKIAKHMYKHGYDAEGVAQLLDISVSTAYRIKRAKSYKGKNGYIAEHKVPAGHYDNVMKDYLDMPKENWLSRLKRRIV